MIRILVPPGIGDIYWVLVKLKSFLCRENISLPSLTVVCSPDKYNGHLRSIPFLKMFSFVQIGSPESIPNDPDLYDQYLEAYSRSGRTIFPGFMGYDYFISYNGHLNSGDWLETTDPDLECDWFPDMIVSQDQEQFKQECIQKYGKYAVFYFPFFGSFEWHMMEFSVDRITESIKQFVDKSGLIPIFMGTLPDIQENDLLLNMIASIPSAVNLVGSTTLDQTFGLIKGSQLVAGYHSGVTNLAVVFEKKTVLIWSEVLPRSIALSCFPPKTRWTNYRPLFAKDLTIDAFVGEMMEMI